jgi:hypothetical protein
VTDGPKPSRKVQAPRARQHERRPAAGADAARQRILLYALGASGFVALAIVLAVVFLGGGGSGSSANPAGARTALEQAGCTFKSVQASSAGNHLTSETQPIEPPYNTFPPTSGPHMPTPAPWGIYDDPINQKILVHNLEHGGVVVQYGDKAPADTAAQLRTFFEDSPNGIVVAPLPKLGDKIALTAWNAEPISSDGKSKPGRGYLALCPRYDAAAFKAFRDAFRYKGPERIPADLMQPGQ